MSNIQGRDTHIHQLKRASLNNVIANDGRVHRTWLEEYKILLYTQALDMSYSTI